MNFSILRRSFSVNTSKSQTKPHQGLDIDETPFSVFRREELSIDKTLSIDSSFGQSSPIYYRSNTNLGVPFQWEKKPGTPMNPSREEVISLPTPIPPSLPPAVQSLVLRRPNVIMKDSSLSGRFWLWRRRLSRNKRIKMYDRRGYHTKFRSNAKGNRVSSNSDGDLDGELVGWIHSDSKSSSASTLSSSIVLSNDHLDSFRKGVSFCCITWRRYKNNKNDGSLST